MYDPLDILNKEIKMENKDKLLEKVMNACIANGIMRESLESMEKACACKETGNLEYAQYYYELSECLDKESRYYKNLVTWGRDSYKNDLKNIRIFTIQDF